jgi:hypothetical protein
MWLVEIVKQIGAIESASMSAPVPMTSWSRLQAFETPLSEMIEKQRTNATYGHKRSFIGKNPSEAMVLLFMHSIKTNTMKKEISAK